MLTFHVNSSAGDNLAQQIQLWLNLWKILYLKLPLCSTGCTKEGQLPVRPEMVPQVPEKRSEHTDFFALCMQA